MILRHRQFAHRFITPVVFALLLGSFLLPVGSIRADDFRRPFDNLPDVFMKKLPESVEDLKAMEDHMAALVDRVMPAVVCVRIGPHFGSGVIVSKDGYVLTAGHVSGAPNRDCFVYFHDGKKAKGITLGGNHGIDSGLIKITDQGKWSYVEMGNSAQVKKEQWCMVCAHPGGYKVGRTPPVRLGRIKGITADTLTTECILVGGDSGGPLFDMYGRVIGINSRIGGSIAANMHVTVNPFRDSWDRLAKGEVFGGSKFGGGQPAKGTAYLGVKFDTSVAGCVIGSVDENSPAAKAGLQAGDVILKADGKDVASGDALTNIVRQKTPGSKLSLLVQRGEEMHSLTAVLGKR